MVFGNGVKNIQAAAYNDARTVVIKNLTHVRTNLLKYESNIKYIYGFKYASTFSVTFDTPSPTSGFDKFNMIFYLKSKNYGNFYFCSLYQVM